MATPDGPVWFVKAGITRTPDVRVLKIGLSWPGKPDYEGQGFTPHGHKADVTRHFSTTWGQAWAGVRYHQ